MQNGHRQIARALGVPFEDVDIVCSGINHQTWYLDIRVKGRPVGADELLAAFERHPVFSRQEKVRIDVLRRFGFYSTESNGHLSEYLPWYRKRPDEIMNWIDLSDWIHGETGGYLRYTTENRNWFEEDFPKFLAEAAKPLSEHERTDEHASHILEALETGRPYRGHFNVRNGGTITNLPEDCIIESPGFVDRFGINMVEGVTLPLACAATCSASVNVQRMAVEAAVTGDVMLLKQAVLHDPLVGAICTPDEVWQMVDELLVAQAAVAPPVRRRHPRRRRAPEVPQGQDPRLAGRRPPGRPQRRGAPRRRPPQGERRPRPRHRAHGLSAEADSGRRRSRTRRTSASADLVVTDRLASPRPPDRASRRTGRTPRSSCARGSSFTPSCTSKSPFGRLVRICPHTGTATCQFAMEDLSVSTHNGPRVPSSFGESSRFPPM